MTNSANRLRLPVCEVARAGAITTSATSSSPSTLGKSHVGPTLTLSASPRLSAIAAATAS